MPKPRTVCFVCTGNTCRSPMAEVLFRAELERAGLSEKFNVCSFGLAAECRAPATQHAQEVVKSFGCDLSKHQSYGAQDLMRASSSVPDIFIGMTPGHLHALKTLPAMSFCIGEFFPENARSREVPDPFGGTLDDYQAACKAIMSAFPRLIQFLKNLD